MRITLQADTAEVTKMLQTFVQKFPSRVAQGLNRTAWETEKAIVEEMQSVFDRPTPYTINSTATRKADAKKGRLEAEVYLRYHGGKGGSAHRYMQPEIEGGKRHEKRSEMQLRQTGVLPSGMSIVPGPNAPLDQYGNVPGSWLVQLISRLRGFNEVGYTANRKAGTSSDVFAIGFNKGLKPGIWQRNGRSVRMLMAFTGQPKYQPRLDFEGVGARVAQTRLLANVMQAIEDVGGKV